MDVMENASQAIGIAAIEIAIAQAGLATTPWRGPQCREKDRVPTRSGFRAGDIAKGACAPRLLPEEA
jgi:hypothetical protein